MRQALDLWLLGAPSTGKRRLANELRNHEPQSAQWQVSTSQDVPASANSSDGLVLLMGLDLPVHGSPQAEQGRREADSRLRGELELRGMTFRVIYGLGDDRLKNALNAIEGSARLKTEGVRHERPWVWSCEKCSDSECEHRLLTELIANRERST